jgi:hypothetical protein
MYLVINLKNFLTSARYIHEDAEGLFLFKQHKREPAQDFFLHLTNFLLV